MSENKKKYKILPFVLGGLILIAGYFGITKLLYVFNNEDTENAYIETNIINVSPKTLGFITDIRVSENQKVKKGDTLALIDDRELKIKVLQAEIALKNAQVNLDISASNINTAKSNSGFAKSNFETTIGTIDAVNAGISTAQSNVEVAKVRFNKANEDLKRYSNLLADKSVTQQQFDAIKTEKEAAEAQYNAAQHQLEVVYKQVEVAKRQSNAGKSQENIAQNQFNSANKQVELSRVIVEQKVADLEFAKLQLSYATIVAPCNGIISKKVIQVGQLVNIGTLICSIVDEENMWITANFKETQVAKMKKGDIVKIDVDAFPKNEFEGEIESIAAATGAKFALLPPDNASGNFVKVVQRIPVKIIIKHSNNENIQLRAGMSAKAIVPVH